MADVEDINDRSQPCGCRWIRFERFDGRTKWAHVVACPDHHDVTTPPWATEAER